jgi:hypothetical protein
MSLPKHLSDEDRKAAFRADYKKRRKKILAQKSAKRKDPKWLSARRKWETSPKNMTRRRARDKKRYAEDKLYRADKKKRTAARRSEPGGQARNRAQAKAWREKFPEKKRASSARYDKANRPKIRKYMRTYKRRRLATDPAFKISEYLRRRVRLALAGTPKSGTTENLVGCSWEQLREWIEAMFQPNMAWKNYGEWEVDHIIPCAKFDLTDPEQQRACFHYSNLQPLWGKDNRIKGSR